MPSKLIDDYDASRVTKVGNWDLGGDPNEFNSTLSFSTTVGDTISVSFNGTYVAVVGLWDSGSQGAVHNYSIDGALPDQVTTPAAAGDVLRQLFWLKQGLAPGPHTLRVTLHEIKSGPIWFDYFLVDDSNPDVPTELLWNGNTSTYAAQPRQSSGQGHKSPFPVGAIVGIVIGGLIFLLEAFVLLSMCRRMRRDPAKTRSALTEVHQNRESVVGQSLIEPFIMSPGASEEAAPSLQPNRANLSEHITPAPTFYVRGPPPRGDHKSFTSDSPSGLQPIRSRESINASSTSLCTNSNSLPPGARPPALITSTGMTHIPGLHQRLGED